MAVRVFALVSQYPQWVEAHLAQGIRQVHQPEVLHALAFGVLRTLNGDPFDLSDQMPFVARNQHIAVDAWEGARCAGIEGHAIRCLDVEQHLDLVGRDKVDGADTQRIGISQGGHAHTRSLPSEAPASGAAALAGCGSVPMRCLSSSLMRKVVLSIAGLGR